MSREMSESGKMSHTNFSYFCTQIPFCNTSYLMGKQQIISISAPNYLIEKWKHYSIFAPNYTLQLLSREIKKSGNESQTNF